MTSISESFKSGKKKVSPKYVLTISFTTLVIAILMKAISDALLENIVMAYSYFILLGIIGGKMIYESFKNDEENNNSSFAIKVMLGMAIATSIDALAAGIPLATDNQNIWINITAIGVITFLFSYLGTFLGFKLGNVLQEKLGNKVEIIGGIILILLGLKILIEHLFL